MERDIKLKNHGIVAKACLVEKEIIKTTKGENYEIDVSIVTAVDLKGSKALQMASGDFGIVVYNELNFGFMISWNEFEKLQADLKISEEKYEEYLDNFMNDFSDTVIDFINQ
ncbi:hypothetical protein N5T90_10445 [Aliarcobacter cryaerophilus]|uniref:hypothetical protein n=1 Tax=Aliarcobacter cryaerophilus TaxID=28198 RepID=UPI0021B695D1|nr:hypothetical protein [Aliarcobacter cryaerophilus]MCT7471295.1 hypothetical protein [Aliarcobacter cryaerophilus]